MTGVEQRGAARARGPARLLGGRYELVRLLGRGATGEVHCAHDRLLGRDVAVKLFRAGVELGDDPRRRRDEMRVLAGMSHPHVVPAYDAGEDDGVAYLVMQLVEGRTLRDCVPLPAQDVLRLAQALSSALAHVHGQGVVHRDVKPANVLLGDDGGVWLSDFGIAKIVDGAAVTAMGLTVGTAGYMAPEQVRGDPVGPASDVYALGLVLLEALTGTRPYPGDSYASALARLHSGPDVPADLPRPWPELLREMTADDPAARPSAASLVERLADRAVTRPAASWPTGAPVAARRRTSVVPGRAVGPTSSPSPAPRGVLQEVLAESVRSRVLQSLVAGLLLVTVSIAALLAGTGGSSGSEGATPAVAAEPDGDGAAGGPGTPASQPALPVRAVRLFHPGGSGADDPEDAPRAADGDPGTAWESQRYATPQFGNLRPGVGLLYDLGEAVAVREVRVQLPYPGAAVRLHAGNTANDALLDTAARAAAKDAPGQLALAVPDGTAARFWVLWFERLPERGQRRASVAETSFLSR